MKTKIELEARPFDVPSKVVVKSPKGVGADIELPLCAFDGNTLERLCDEFRDAVFIMSGVQRPPQDANK